MTKEEIIEMVMQIGGCDRPEDDSPIQGRYEFMGEGASECAGAIRARGQA